MDKVILYFGYVMFFLVCFYLIFILCSYLLISLGETLKKIKYNKNSLKDNNQTINSNKNRNPIKSLIMNAYEGLYRLLVFKTGRLPLNWLRKRIYKHVFKMHIEKNVVIHKGLEIRGGIKYILAKVQ